MAEEVNAAISAASAGFLRAQITQSGPKGDDLKAPENIIPTLQAARPIYFKYRTDHLKRIQLYSQIEGLIAGNPPYNPAELQKMGISHIANFNTLEARSLYERGALAYWNLLNEAETICDFNIRIKDPRNVHYSDILASNFDYAVRKWKSFYTQMNMLTGQLVKFGISPVLWPDERDWRFKVIELSRFLVQDQAQSDISQLTIVFVESIFTAQYLFEVYEAYKDKPEDESPWSKEELAHLLLYFANSWAKLNGQDEFTNMLTLQLRLQNGDIGFDTIFTDGIRLVSCLNEEYDGKVTHSMFHRYYDNVNTTGEFLFFSSKQYECIEDALLIFTASPGEFTIHSNRGLGHKIFSAAQAQMRLDCSIVDMARMSATPLVQSPATGNKDFSTIRFLPGVAANLGSAVFVQNQLGANIQQLVGASQFLSQKIQFNLANSGDDPGMPDRNQGSISPTQAKIRSYKEFGIQKHNIAHFYNSADILWNNVVRKLLHSKKGWPGYECMEMWKTRCLEDGLPEVIFDIIKKENSYGGFKFLDVKATRVAGDGSTVGRITALQDLSPLVPSFTAEGVREYQRQYIMATQGKDAVDVYLPSETDTDEKAGGASLAAVENAVMRAGESGVVSPDNEHRSHFVTHMALATSTIQAIQQQQTDAIAADRIFTVLLPHMQEHWQFIASNPLDQGFVQQLKKPWEQVSEYARLNKKNANAMMQAQIRKQQQAQEKQQQVMTDAQRKDFVAQSDVKRADFKVGAQVQRAKEASDSRAEIMREKVVRDSDTSRLKIQIDNQNETIDNQPLEQTREDLRASNGITPAPNDIE